MFLWKKCCVCFVLTLLVFLNAKNNFCLYRLEDFYLYIFIRINIFYCDLLSALTKLMGEFLSYNCIALLDFSVIVSYFTLFIRFYYISDDGYLGSMACGYRYF